MSGHYQQMLCSKAKHALTYTQNITETKSHVPASLEGLSKNGNGSAYKAKLPWQLQNVCGHVPTQACSHARNISDSSWIIAFSSWNATAQGTAFIHIIISASQKQFARCVRSLHRRTCALRHSHKMTNKSVAGPKEDHCNAEQWPAAGCTDDGDVQQVRTYEHSFIILRV